MSNTDEGKKLEATYGVTGHPAFVVMNATGDVIDRWAGYRNADGFVAALSTAVADPTTIDQKKARFAASPTAKDAATIGRIHGMRGDAKDALAFYRKAAELDPAGPYRQPIFDQMVALHGQEDGGIKTEDVVAAGKAMLADASAPKESKVMAYFGMREVAGRAKDMKLIAPFLDAALETTKDAPENDRLRNMLLIDQALHVKGDETAAVALRKQGMPEGWMTEPGRLNEFAWWCFENKVNLAEAEALARKGVELSGAGADRAMILDTLAELCNLRGACPEAVTLMKQAIKEDPDSEHYPKQLERFEKAAAGKS